MLLIRSPKPTVLSPSRGAEMASSQQHACLALFPRGPQGLPEQENGLDLFASRSRWRSRRRLDMKM